MCVVSCVRFIGVYTHVPQVEELKLHDKWAESCVPSGGAVVNPDPTGRRNGCGKTICIHSSRESLHFYLQLLMIR